MLRWLGHHAAAVLDGGFAAWTAEGRQVTAEVPAFGAATFTPRRTAPSVDAGAVAASLASGSLLLIDARGRERFRGDVEAIDPVAGHIPGAVNRPYLENLDAAGRFKPASVLRAEFGALVGARAPATIVHTCGSGVSACHNVLAMEHAGLGGTALYPGSWSEWCADPARPVARGDA
jgi:thiosulfate/3-mercaptopyruvate sulfurtransferase